MFTLKALCFLPFMNLSSILVGLVEQSDPLNLVKFMPKICYYVGLIPLILSNFIAWTKMVEFKWVKDDVKYGDFNYHLLNSHSLNCDLLLVKCDVCNCLFSINLNILFSFSLSLV